MSRRTFLSAAAVAPALAAAAPTLAVSDLIAQFVPPPDRVRILAVVARSVGPPPEYNAEELKQITSQGKNVELIVPSTVDEANKALPEVDVVFGALDAEMFARAVFPEAPSRTRPRWHRRLKKVGSPEPALMWRRPSRCRAPARFGTART